MNDKLTTKTTEREKIKCDYFPLCSGCQKQDEIGEQSRHRALEDALKRKISLIVDGITFWRHKVKLAIGEKFSDPVMGLYKKNSHEIISIPNCPLHTRNINPALHIIKRCIQDSKISIYNEKTFKGFLRYVQVVEENLDGKLGITFVVNESLDEVKNHPFFSLVLQRLEGRISSLWLNEKMTKDNVIFGKNWLHVFGKTHTNQKILGKVYFFHPASFCQVHLKQYENVLNQIKNLVKPLACVLELYAGVGTIGKSLSEKVLSVDLYESNPSAQEGFLLANELHPDKNLQFFPKPAEDFIELKEYDTLIVDPPRKGMSLKVLEKVTRLANLREMILLYCDSDSFLRDVRFFEERSWRLTFVESYLFFPGSDHIEVLGKLEKI